MQQIIQVLFEFPNSDGTAGQVLQTDGYANLSFATVGGGITMADQWRLTTSITGGGTVITSNLERNDTSGFGGIGTGMTQSSGEFTFPTTGIYLVTAQGYWSSSGVVSYMGIITKFTINNSTYIDQAINYDSSSGGSYHGATFTAVLLDVTDTANCKVIFQTDVASNSQLVGSTSTTRTGFTFIRLGDT